MHSTTSRQTVSRAALKVRGPVASGGRPGLAAALLALALLPAPAVDAQSTGGAGSGIAATVHNLSVSGPGEIRSLTETEICKFCHIPHNPVVADPLWGHTLSQQQYSVPRSPSAGPGVQLGGQPDGSSRLCFSCHDGTVALGDLGGRGATIPMTGFQRLSPGRPGYLGTDLSGSHPISFIVPNGEPANSSDRDMGLRPLAAIHSDPDVELDDQGKMQCTTCHDPHADRFYQPGEVPRFWVKPTVAEVCLTCHELR